MNINKLCAQCNQIVYPLEQLKCLDQVWHRRCFRCETCHMALSMINYRGYEKKPYCSAHYPQPKRFTVVADTPELQRVAQNTRVFSNINYNQRQGPGGTLDRRPASEKSCPASSADSSTHPPAYFPASGRSQYNGGKVDQLHSTGQSLPPNGVHYENGNSRLLYSSCSASPGQPELTDPMNVRSSVHNTNLSTNGFNPNYVDVMEPIADNVVLPNTNSKFRAMYDYQAKEDDEVSFLEGDVILHGDPITEGWMYGTVQRTGQFGMLPSNYVEPIE